MKLLTYFELFPDSLSIITDTFTPSEIAFLYVFRSPPLNMKCGSKCLKSRILTNLPELVIPPSPHAYQIKTYPTKSRKYGQYLYNTNTAHASLFPQNISSILHHPDAKSTLLSHRQYSLSLLYQLQGLDIPDLTPSIILLHLVSIIYIWKQKFVFHFLATYI